MNDLAAAEALSRRSRALAGAQSVTAALKRRGIEVKIIGSLASGDFGPSSDIDFLVTSCVRQQKYAIESLIEDHLGDLPFDVVYLDEVPPSKLDRMSASAIDASDLR